MARILSQRTLQALQAHLITLLPPSRSAANFDVNGSIDHRQ